MANDLTSQLNTAMQQYTAVVRDEISKAMKRIGEEAKQRVKDASPVKTGKYKRGWTVDVQTKNGSVGVEIYNKSGWKTRLLEKGHKKVNGRGNVDGIPHIEPVERWAEEEVEKAIEKAVKG